VALLPDLSPATVDRLGEAVAAARRPGDVVVVSVHWGGNWGYPVPVAHRRFAHQLVDRAGVHVVHGHSSHHALGVEVHHGRLVLYGCGDLLTDYEGISGHEAYRGDLGGLYLADVDPDGELRRLRMVPTRVARFRLTAPDADDLARLANVLDRESAPLGARAEATDGGIELRW
jgi:poly-gamma-glutamate synthesis protein (capsule biosynthesis protein)